MTHPEAEAEPLVSLSAAAKALGINKATLWRQSKAGKVRSHDGKFRMSELTADRANNIDASKNPNWGRERSAGPLPVTQPETGEATAVLSFADERARKERAVADLREQEFERRSGKLIDREIAERAAFDFAREFRDALMNWPARVAAVMAADVSADPVKLHVALEQHLRELLAELANNQLRLAGMGGDAGGAGARGDAGTRLHRL